MNAHREHDRIALCGDIKAHKRLSEMAPNCQVVEVVQRTVVTADNLPAFQGLIPLEQQAEIHWGDCITLLLFYNGTKKCHGTMTIWHNSARAAIKSTDINQSGEWDERCSILVTDEVENAWTIHGEEISGRIAFDLLGFEGIMSCGQFFRASPLLFPNGAGSVSTSRN